MIFFSISSHASMLTSNLCWYSLTGSWASASLTYLTWRFSWLAWLASLGLAYLTWTPKCRRPEVVKDTPLKAQKAAKSKRIPPWRPKRTQSQRIPPLKARSGKMDAPKAKMEAETLKWRPTRPKYKEMKADKAKMQGNEGPQGQNARKRRPRRLKTAKWSRSRRW